MRMVPVILQLVFEVSISLELSLLLDDLVPCQTLS